MCQVHDTVGSLKAVKNHLKKHGINEFNSLNEVMNFQKNVNALKTQQLEEHEQLVRNELDTMPAALAQLNDAIHIQKARAEQMCNAAMIALQQQLTTVAPTARVNLIKWLTNTIKHRRYQKQLQQLTERLEDTIADAVSHLVQQQQRMLSRYQYIQTHFKQAVEESAAKAIQQLDYKKRVIDEVNNAIYGAIGEHKVVKELEQ